MTADLAPAVPQVALRRWMLVSIAAVFLAVSVGGITRLTESGLDHRVEAGERCAPADERRGLGT